MDKFSKIRDSSYPKDIVTGLIAGKDLAIYIKWGDLKEQQPVFVWS